MKPSIGEGFHPSPPPIPPLPPDPSPKIIISSLPKLVSVVGDQNLASLPREDVPKNTNLPKSHGHRVMRRPRGDTRFKPFLADLRVPEFVRDTAAFMDRRTTGSNPSGTGSVPIEVEMEISDQNQLREGLSSGSPRGGKDPNNITGQVRGSTAPSRTVGGPISCIEVPTQAGDIDPTETEMVGSEIAPSSIHYGNISIPPSVTQSGLCSVWNSPVSGMESFADKIKKSNEMEGLKLEYFPPTTTQDGGCRIHISLDDLKLSAQKCINKPKPMEEEVVVPPSSHPGAAASTELELNPKGPRVLPVANNSNDIGLDNEGFTVVNRWEPGLSLETKSSQIPSMSGSKVSGLHINTHSDYARKDVTNLPNTQAQNGLLNGGGQKSKGFDFSRAVNGSAGVSKPGPAVQPIPSQPEKNPPASRPAVTVPDGNWPRKSQILQPSSSSAGMTEAAASVVPIDVDQPTTNLTQQPNLLPVHPSVDTHNSFMVLDFQKSFKFNKLVGDSLDPGMYDQSNPSAMDPDKCNEPQQEQLVCQVNREFIEGVRILPSSIVSPMKSYQQSSGQEVSLETPSREEVEVKDYGISDAQKLAITSRLCGPAQAVRAVDMDNWEQGEHEFFEDQVKAMGLDYDYCVEDVESDDENGTAQFFSAQMKVGMPKILGHGPWHQFSPGKLIFLGLFDLECGGPAELD
ncbi:hypothetical protein L1987_42308 [Smallanthus sonchifolius]|uniref:Uncharacterized protein n=1 Tax=Smallanthus sonchifolius TaxID=185202 RepID=A0ACB9GID1_9ASTR|nr:hypothetical protein L1987_42308 [Smallanthus sonchifolius]